jgi:transposase-like protein
MCDSGSVAERSDRTARGYRRFRYRDCGRQFNERGAGLLNRARFPLDVIALGVFFRLRCKLSLRDVAEMFLLRGIEFSHDRAAKRIDGRQWEALLTPTLISALRRRQGSGSRAGRSWFCDETYIKGSGRWHYLYRAIDRAGNLVDVMLSQKRDIVVAIAFFRSAKAVTGVAPSRVTTDGHDGYPRAIRTTLGMNVRHRTSRYRSSANLDGARLTDHLLRVRKLVRRPTMARGRHYDAVAQRAGVPVRSQIVRFAEQMRADVISCWRGSARQSGKNPGPRFTISTTSRSSSGRRPA